jgi:hypothetical protein
VAVLAVLPALVPDSALQFKTQGTQTMKTYLVKISARKEGAIGTHGTERREYEIQAESPHDVNRLAIERAYQEGGLEHVRVHAASEKR